MKHALKTVSHVFLLLVILSAPLRAEAGKALNILFIGNSYTFYNSMPIMLESMANEGSETPQLTVAMTTLGGATLQRHWTEGRALKAIEKGGWDYVVLQEHSRLGGSKAISDPETFHAYVTLFDAEIKRAGAKTALMLTWAREHLPETQITLNKAYGDIAAELNVLLVPVGPVWQQVRGATPDLQLYTPDRSHPTAEGSYVIASVFYAHFLGDTLVGKSGVVTGQTINYAGTKRSAKKQELVRMPDEHARLIQQLATKSIGAGHHQTAGAR